MTYSIALSDNTVIVWDDKREYIVHVIKNVSHATIKVKNTVVILYEGAIMSVERFNLKNCDDYINKQYGEFMQELIVDMTNNTNPHL